MDDKKGCSAQRETERVFSLISSQDPENMEPNRSWSDLQPEILSLILSNLFFRDSSNFNASCRSWKSICPPFPPPTGSLLSKLPYLMTLNGSNCKFFQPLRNEMYQKEISELKNARIRFSKYGWLLMSHGESSMFFFHPFTMVKIELPDLPTRNWFKNICFLSRPTSSDCTVIGISSHTPEHIEFCIIKCGEDKWTYQDMGTSIHFIISAASPELYNGKLYCLGEAGNLGVLDLSNNIGWTSWEVCSKPLSRSSCYKFRQSFMVKCDDGMLVVSVTHEDRRVLVEKCYLPEMFWEDVESLGDKMVFVSHGASLLGDAVEKGMANKIYFPKFHGESGVFYSLDTEMYHSILGNYSCRTSFNLAEQLSCTWINDVKYSSNSLSTVQKW
ncbi:hypothetical protein RHMOL_Rhmol10G0263400 [Rhododendron molle]|uniref:Uncharacterized protein n=1 Tax=Rhododendron molle TaxID=49168 RepID=A0ACC0M658_RHOML|nr:hypothetical protein RHMOL_Rhmol10G0263400 [Rhododendron molle]